MMKPKKSNIYTRGGDKGYTSLVGGKRIRKDHPRVEAYGDIDELMANNALLMDMVDEKQVKNQLLFILNRLMITASIIACNDEDCSERMPKLSSDDIKFLEDAIDEMDSMLPALHSFILPGGAIPASYAHIARTVCRRTERNALKLDSDTGLDPLILQFLNRLSDYYFLLSRKLLHDSGQDEILWKE